MNKDKIAIILRGVSGCGKSTVAEYFAWLNSGDIGDEFPSEICTADDYFMSDGRYKFDPKDLFAAHLHCFNKFKKAINDNFPLVIQANTNTKEKDFQHYIDYAEQHGYTVFVLVVENRHGGRDKHKVPEESLQKQECSLKTSLKLR